MACHCITATFNTRFCLGTQAGGAKTSVTDQLEVAGLPDAVTSPFFPVDVQLGGQNVQAFPEPVRVQPVLRAAGKHVGRAEIASGDLAWDGTNKELEITLSGYDNPPVVLATPVAVDSAYAVKAHASSATKAVVRFYNIDTGAKITTEDANMDCNVLVIGA